jgi:hypothetical protein
MRKDSIRAKGVFLYDAPTIKKLKACSLFWKNVVVFESYLSDVAQDSDLVDVTLSLLKNDVLKICHTPDGLKSALRDKIYCNLDKNLWEYIYRNAEKATIEPRLPVDAERIIRESTDRDVKDTDLQQLIDEIIRNGIENKWLDTIREYDGVPFDLLPEEVKKGAMFEIRRLVDIEYEHYRKRGMVRYGFEWRNKYFLEQTSVSSALFARSAWLPYYQHKLGNYAITDARRYLQGLNAIIPFVKRDSIDSFSLDEILEIRRNRRWNNAMDRLGELCSEIKYGTNIRRFKEELKENVISEYQDTLEEEEITWRDLNKQLLKGSVFTGISLIPIVGNLVSTAVGFVDPIISYLRKKRSQRNLPFFLTDLRKMRALK